MNVSTPSAPQATPCLTYTWTDEAPALATAFLYPILQVILPLFGVKTELKSIALADRILALLADELPGRTPDDHLSELQDLVRSPTACLIKLPNISASLFQLKACIAELQAAGYPLPPYPENPQTKDEQRVWQLYQAALGSAVNPKLRIGNSIRYIPPAVKRFAAAHPHSMGTWAATSRTKVTSMSAGSFYHTEQAVVADEPKILRIVFRTHESDKPPTDRELVGGMAIAAGDLVDAATMSRQALKNFVTTAKQAATTQDLIFSLHLKATMMKVSDPTIFGYVIETFLAPFFEKYHSELTELGIDPRQGVADMIQKISSHYTEPQPPMLTDLLAALHSGPRLAMVNSDQQITQLHISSDTIIDASMAALIRGGGKVWDKDGATGDTLALIPDPSYADLYQETISFCQTHGAFDPTTMGSVSNIGLMAHKAQEYGSHPTTFIAPAAGSFRLELSSASGDGDTICLEHHVAAGDIWRMCLTKHDAITNWIQTIISHVKRPGRDVNEQTIIWLDPQRAHDAALAKITRAYLQQHAPELLAANAPELAIHSPHQACQLTLQRLKDGENTVSATGNVLRDYITDLFPILELGTSAKMLSVIGLLGGGHVFETGSGGTAPKHVTQFQQENHLRWDSLGEFLALEQAAAALAQNTTGANTQLLADAFQQATAAYLKHGWSPSRKCGENDTRASHILWLTECCKVLAGSSQPHPYSAALTELSAALQSNQALILAELIAAQGQPLSSDELGGYYAFNLATAQTTMSPSPIFNNIWADFVKTVKQTA